MNSETVNWEKPKISAELDFTKRTGSEIAALRYGKEWSIVYMIFNKKEMYIGETVDASTRMFQHYGNTRRRNLEKVRFVYSNGFNKSSILDLESYLISHISADGQFKLQNDNAGHQKHNYWQQEKYRAQFAGIWKELQDLKLAKKSLSEIENDNLFKFSPYKDLTDNQFIAANNILNELKKDILNNRESTFIVNGGPGTGKTVLAIYLAKLLLTYSASELGIDDKSLIRPIREIHKILPNPKIGIVVSMSNLRKILKSVLKHFDGGKDIVLSPSDVANYKGKYDILIVDEAHRLKAPRNVGAEIGNIQKNNAKLKIDKANGTQLDWIMKKSKHQIFFYDEFQSIKRADVDPSHFKKLIENGAREYLLETQIRCGKGGSESVKYIRQLFSNDNRPEKPICFQNKNPENSYDFFIFDNVYKMTEKIRKMNVSDDVGLCRNIAGYAWEWKTKGKVNPRNLADTKRCIEHGLYDIDIEGHKYIWNTQYDGWVSSPNSENEIGCIHTIQGFDLNYAGVIIGNELKYNKETDKLYIDKKEYYDKNGKNKTSEEDLEQYIFNIYYVLCTRGINGTYIYACDEGVREYLKKFIKTYTEQ